MHLKRALTSLLVLVCLMAWFIPVSAETLTKYSSTFFGSFDTVTTLIGYAKTEEEFRGVLNETQNMMMRYHMVFDGYNAYEGVNNLYYVNQNAGIAPVKAEDELIELILWAKDVQEKLGGRMNIAMGAVLSIWHEYRTEGVALPEMDALVKANEHVNMDNVIVDAENGTVYFDDPEMSLDLGAVAKGYTVEKVAKDLLEKKMPSFLLNAGGNVRCGIQPQDGRASWGVSIQDPGDGVGPVPSTYMDVLYVNDCSVVTSGDYQRYYEVDGVRYHHIIDPETLMPSRNVRGVTIVTEDSGFADALSTTLFILDYETGLALVESLPGTEAYWILPDGSIHFTDGMKDKLYSQR